MFRRLFTLCLALALFALPATASASTGVAVGTAETTLDLARVTLAGLPADLPTLSLATLRAYASTDTDAERNSLGAGRPFALAGLGLPGDQGVQATSTDAPGQPGRQVSLPGGTGDVTAGTLTATATDGTAAAVLEALSARLALPTFAVSAAAPGSGVVSTVDGTTAAVRNGAALTDLRIGLTDLLPLELLEQLPLDVLIGLLDSLPIDLGTSLDPVLDLARELVDVSALVREVQAAIDDAQVRLDELAAALADAKAQVPSLTAVVTELTAQLETVTANLATVRERADAVAAAEAGVSEVIAAIAAALDGLDVDIDAATACDDPAIRNLVEGLCEDLVAASDVLTDARAQLAATEAALGTVSALQDEVVSLTAELDRARAELVDIQALVAQLQQSVDEVQALLDKLVGDLDDLLRRLIGLLDQLAAVDLVGLLEGLVEGLAGMELLSIEEIAIGVTTAASGTGSSASGVCDVRGLAVLGQPVAVESCDDLEDVLAGLAGTIRSLLAELPVAVSALAADTVTVRGPQLSKTPDNAREGDFHVARVTVAGLALQVQPLTLTSTAGGFASTVIAIAEGALAGLPVNLDPALLAQVEDAAAAALEQLLGGLPDGSTLEGVRTPAVEVAALDLVAGSQFNVAGTNPSAGLPPADGGVPPADGGAGTPVRTPWSSGVGGPNLPVTGGGVGLVALGLLGLGGGGLWLLRRRPVA